MSNHSLHTCGGRPGVCWDWLTEMSLTLENTIILFVNMIHIIVILRLLQKNYDVFKAIVFATSIVDIVYSVGNVIGTNCFFRENILRSKLLGILGCNIVYSGLFLRYHVLALQSVERVYALKYPFQYATSFLVRHDKVTIAITFGSALVVLNLLLLPLINPTSTLCIDLIHSIGVQDRMTSTLLSITAASTTLLIIVCICMTSIAVWKLRSRSLGDQRHSNNNKTSLFVIFSALTFLLCLVPNIIRVLLVGLGIKSGSLGVVIAVCVPLYGLLNCILFAGFSANYRDTLKRLLTCTSQRIFPTT